MAANVESMFYTRKAPWHGLGVRVEEVLGSKEALIQAGLDWKVEQTDVYAASGERIPGYKANIRDIDRSVLGIVGDRYKIVQNEEAFAFTDGLLGEGVKYETAGSLAGGKIVWMLAKLPEKYIISGDAIEPYLVFCNSHDGSGAIRVAMTPVRVVCQNTLNLALKGASRVWSARHTGFPTDMQPQMAITLGLSTGTSTITESIFENRFRYVEELRRMGANIKMVEGNTAIIHGVEKYTGASVAAPDLRAGAALVIAGLAAEGYTTVTQIGYIQRGYERFDEKLRALGGLIEKVDSEKETNKFIYKTGTVN